MSLHDLLKNSLRVRLIVGMAAMLLPLLVLAVGTVIIFESLLGTFIEVTRETIEEIQPNLTLQRQMTEAHLALDNYAEDGRPAAALIFRDHADHIDASFNMLVRAPFSRNHERLLVVEARREWGRAKSAGLEVVATRDPAADPDITGKVERFGGGVQKSQDLLGQANAFDTNEIREELTVARAGRSRTLTFIAGAFLAGLGIAGSASFLLARSILRPVEALEGAVRHLGGGEFDYRVKMSGEDELGRLGEAFNGMARRLEIDQAALEELATHDSLTAVINRRQLFKLLVEEVERSARYGFRFSVLMIDLDRFKLINDTYGHRAGDKVLRGVVASLAQALRPVDKIGRYGGEEFVVILPQTDGAGAENAAERIRTIIEALRVPIGSAKAVNRTVSIGVAVFPDDARTDEDLMNKADEALYEAKRAGRNCFRRYGAGKGRAA